MFQFVAIIVIAVLVLLDQLSKQLISSVVLDYGEVEFFGGLFRLTYVENTGAAFSFFSENTVALTIITSVIILVCLVMLMKKKDKSRFFDISLMLVIAGGIGNVIDRVAKGFVVDFIEPLFINFAVFNLADCFITVGAIMLLGYELAAGIKTTGKERKAKNEDETGTGV